MDPDQVSTFSCDEEYQTKDSFSLCQLNTVADRYFGQQCVLSKLAQGGFHKVYDVSGATGTPLEAVIRVASPAFPKDKLESEVATIKFLASRTSIPVPQIYLWNSDRTNPVGAEYIIMEKIRGAPAQKVWGELDLNKKQVAVRQLAHHLVALFRFRFHTGGSLYLSSSQNVFTVGPIVIPTYYRGTHSDSRFSHLESTTIQREQDRFRGPFKTVTDYLLCQIRAELKFLALHREHTYLDATDDIEEGKLAVARGEAVLQKALKLYPLFPGDMPVYSPMSSPDKPFSIYLADFHPSNVMIDVDTGDITGLIDLEGTRIAPTWACATIPGWLLHLDHEESFPSDEPSDVRAVLRDAYLDAVREADPTGEWERAHLAGRPYRYFARSADYGVSPWGYRANYVDRQLEWCKAHPGVVYDGPIDPTLPGLDQLPYIGHY